jgi:hypothetical protein
MPTPLPAVVPADYGQTLNAYRTGQQDRIAQDERNLLKEAGGLAAAGNMKGAQAALYKGGNFSQAQNISQELRAQSAEGRAAASHARAMKDADLERASKTYELFGRLIPAIGDDPQKLEMAKALIKQRTGQDFSAVTIEQLPMLYKQGIDIKSQIDMELRERQLAAEEARSKLAQSNVDRSFSFQAEEAKRAQANTDRSFGLSREQFEETKSQNAGQLMANRTREEIQRESLAIQRQRLEAAAAKASAPKPLTAEQAKARGYLGEMSYVEENLPESLTEKRESPLSPSDQRIAMNDYVPGEIQNMALNKKQKQYLQAAEQFISVLLYHRSGAQISTDEFKRNFRIYFPQPGDDQRTLRMKEGARKRVMDGMKIQGAVDSPAGAPSNDLSGMSDDDLLRQLSE